MKERSTETVTVPPTVQKFERLQTIEREHRNAMERAVSLNVPHAVDAAESEPTENNEAEASSGGGKDASSTTHSRSSGGRSNWDEVVEKLLKNESGDHAHLERDTNVPQ